MHPDWIKASATLTLIICSDKSTIPLCEHAPIHLRFGVIFLVLSPRCRPYLAT